MAVYDKFLDVDPNGLLSVVGRAHQYGEDSFATLYLPIGVLPNIHRSKELTS